MIFSKELKKMAEEYQADDDREKLGPANSFLAGAAALENLIMKSEKKNKFKEFWIKDHKMARTETKAYLYDAFDLPPNLDKSVGVIHVIEYAAHEENQLIIGGLRTMIQVMEAQQDKLIIEKTRDIESLNRQVVELTGKYEYWKRALCSSTPNSYYQKVLDDETKS